MRASQLELAAHQLGCRSLAARVASAAPDRPWQTSWSHGRVGTVSVNAVAAGMLPDGTPVIISGDGGTVRVWRTADGTPVVPLLDLPESMLAVAVYGNVIITAAGPDIAVHQLAFPPVIR